MCYLAPGVMVATDLPRAPMLLSYIVRFFWRSRHT